MEGSTSSLAQMADPNGSTSSLSMMCENGVGTSQYPNSICRREYVEIVEQPASKSLRFRYECEGRSAGSISGASSTSENKTYPSIRVVGYEGRAVVVVSCVTKNEPYKPHPHNLVGREGCKKGVCTLEIPSDTMMVSFSNLGIQCVKKKDIEVSLRTREEIRVDPFRTGFKHRNHPTSIDLNSVRLCFQVFLEGDKKGKFTVPLPPVVSEPIYDKKSSADLVIVKLSDCNSFVDGGRKDIILLCEKVTKEDIQIRFFEEKEGEVVWESYGDFQPNQVHKQTAIWFKTPRYRTLEITEPVKAFIQLKRPSDGATSEALPFEFLPLDAGRPSYWALGKSFMKKGNYNLFSSLLSNTNTLSEGIQVEDIQDITMKDKEEPQIIQENLTQKTILEPSEKNIISTITPEEVIEMNNNEVLASNKESNSVTNENLEEKTFNQLIDEVAELDELYSTTQHNRNNFSIEENTNIDIDVKETQFDDSKTYSSIQLAFRNPLDIAYRPTQGKPQSGFTSIAEETNLDKNTNKRDSLVETLPPLPPKRQRKIETYIGEDEEEAKRLKEALMYPKPGRIIRSHSFNSGAKNQDDLKYLGSTSTLPNPKKRGFFSKLFGRKNKNKSSHDITTKRQSYPSSSSLQLPLTSPIHNETIEHIDKPIIPTAKPNEPLTDVPAMNVSSATPSNPRASIVSAGTSFPNMEEDNLNSMNFDLTDAEHYALYTVMAPHATQSEFDEMSCYYAAVEGGKILS